MDANRKKRNQMLAERVIKGLEARNMEGYYVETKKEALKKAGELDIVLVPYENERGMAATREVIRSIKPGQSIGIFIGPEGGFEESEVQYVMDNGIHPISLGKRILRTETAGLAILSVLMFQLED